jgi:ankyrin repeat protein
MVQKEMPEKGKLVLGASKKPAAKAGKPAYKADILPSGKMALSKKEQKRFDDNLRNAVIYENVFGVLRFIKSGADMNAGDDCGLTALMLAASKGNAQICKLLVKKGADVDVRDNTNRTALMVAAQRKHADICRLLVENGAEVLARDWHERTVLHYAAAGRLSGICTLLIKKGADVNATDRDKRTALDIALESGHTEIADLLQKKMKK